MAGNATITPALFKFLKDLKANNNRDWFAANKPRYIADVRDPLLRLIEDFAGPLAKISEHFEAIASAQGGSLFRIYRDTRFSKDKKPYKENVGVHFRHEAGCSAHAPGFYLHLEPGRCFAGAGIWKPEPEALGQIREAIVEDPAGWKKASQGKAFLDYFGGIEGESLKRPPRGFDPEHPYIDDLKRKDFFILKHFTQQELCSTNCLKLMSEVYRKATPLTRFLTEAVGLPY